MSKHSAHPEIEAGYYHGIQGDIEKETGLSKPVIRKALKDNDTSSSKRHLAVQTALKLIRQRQKAVA